MRRGAGYKRYPSPQATGKRWPYYIELSDRRGCADYERQAGHPQGVALLY
jgi:hypothetical protein